MTNGIDMKVGVRGRKTGSTFEFEDFGDYWVWSAKEPHYTDWSQDLGQIYEPEDVECGKRLVRMYKILVS
jgi:hypothetical protein